LEFFSNSDGYAFRIPYVVRMLLNKEDDLIEFRSSEKVDFIDE
jgi:hypothetical protein